MLAFYERLARRLHGARALLWVVAASGVAGFAGTLLLADGTYDEALMVLSICVLLWGASALTVVHTFVHPLPEIGVDDGFGTRLRIRLAHVMRRLMAWAMTGLCAAVVLVSVRAAGIVLRATSG